MPAPIPPAPNPLPDPVPKPTPLPSIQGYIRPWELARVVLAAFAGGTIGWEMAIPLLQKLSENVDKWVVLPQHQETAQMLIGALVAVLTSVFMVRSYFRAGEPLEKISRISPPRTQGTDE